jgi:N-carbamoylputrescine amidase
VFLRAGLQRLLSIWPNFVKELAMLKVALIADTFFCRRAAERLRQRMSEAKCQGAKLAILPEIPLQQWAPATKHPCDEDAEPLGGSRCQMLSAIAKEFEMHLIGGAIIKSQGRRYNTTLVYNDEGILVDTYRKMHLPAEPGFWEGDHYEVGDAPPHIIQSLVPLGIQTCSDINRPEGSHMLGAMGAELIACPRANEAKHFDAWRPVFQANARCSSAYVVSVNRPVLENGVEFGGPSIVVDPSGCVMLESTAPVCTFELDRAAVERARQDYPGYLSVRAGCYSTGWAAIAQQQQGAEEEEQQQQHCFDKIFDLTSKGVPSQRDIFQIGYNMGRLSEMKGEGRKEWWDAYKGYVERGEWDQVS